MAFDFDTVFDFRDSDSSKWNLYAGRDILPLWVADMDFAAPPAVVQALGERVARGIYGYGSPTGAVVEAIGEALRRDFGVVLAPGSLIMLPGLVCGLNVAARALGGPGDGILVAPPVYPPFLSAPPQQGREAVRVPLREAAGGWEWDWAALEAAVTPQSRALFLCHPHNPVGRVWREDELRRLGDFAERHDLVVVSDEIHCELVLEPGLKHIPFASLSPALARRTITLMAPSKTYNIAGLGAAYAIITDPALRARFREAMAGIVPHTNIMGLVAMAAAYRHGEPWRRELLDYLRGNRERVVTALHGHGGLRVQRPEATYLAWIDCRGAGIDKPREFFEQAGVGLVEGADFGLPGFARLNFGCPRATLDEALRRMRAALRSRFRFS